jgi:hypothetical protein
MAKVEKHPGQTSVTCEPDVPAARLGEKSPRPDAQQTGI